MSRLLIVEDDTNIAAQLRRMLAGKYDIRFVENEADALQELEQNDYDAVLVELFRKQPGLDGLHILRQINQSEPELPLICVSARGLHLTDYFGVAQLFGADGAIAMPFSPNRLVGLIESIRAFAGGPQLRRMAVSA